MSRALYSFGGGLLVAGWLAGCSTPGPVPPEPVAAAPAVAPPAAVPRAEIRMNEFERRQQAQAGVAESQSRLADAAVAWELLTLLRPESATYRDALARVRARIASAVSEKMTAAAAAQRRGELDVAAQAYLEALSFAPDHAGAADALRAVERERNRRSFVGKFSRNTLTRRAVTDGEMRYVDESRPGAPVPGGDGDGHLEHATLLMRQGEFDSAISLLRDALLSRPGDTPIKALLIDVYLQKGERALAKDRRAAKAAAEAALQLQPRHAGAVSLLQRASGAAPRNVAPAASSATRR